MLTKLAKVVVDPTTALRATDASPSQEGAAPVEGALPPMEKIWEFVKNIQINETIMFKDGTSYKFPSSLLMTTDSVLAEKLLEVAGQYHIIHRTQNS